MIKWLKRLFVNDWKLVWSKIFTVSTHRSRDVTFVFKIKYSKINNSYKYSCDPLTFYVRGIEESFGYQEGLNEYLKYLQKGHE